MDEPQNPPDQLEPLRVVASDKDERETANEVSRAETSTDETAAATTASAAIDASAREPDEAKATRDQGYQPITSASARSASRDHLVDTTTTDLARPSEDPADATGDDERRPDEPTEPPDMPEGTGRRDDRQRVDEVGSSEAEVSRELTDGAEATGNDGDDERRPGKPDELPDKPQVEFTDPANVQVEPGSETDAERIGSVVHEHADAGVDGEAVGMCQDVQDAAERSRTRRGDLIEGERLSASARGRSMTTADENNQRNEAVDDDVPEDPPDPPPPLDEPADRQDEPPSVELEGESGCRASCRDELTGAETDASGASQHHEDPRNWPRKLPDRLERVSKRSERGEVENSPRSAADNPDEPDGETDVPGGAQRVQERPRDDRNGRVVETNVLRRDTGPGDPRGEQEASRGVEGVRDRRKVVDDAEHDGICHGRDGSGGDVETNAPGRDRGPGGQSSEQEAMGDVERDWKRENAVGGAGYDGRWCRMDGATSGARCNSKRVGTRSLAEEQTSQHEQRKRTTAHVPRPPIPPPSHHR